MEVSFADIAERATLPQVTTLPKNTPWFLFAGVIALYIALVPNLILLPETALYDGKRLLQLGLLLSLGVGLSAFCGLREGWKQTVGRMPVWARAGLSFILALGVVSAIAAPMPGYAFLEVGHYVLLFALAAFVAASYQRWPGHFDTTAVAVLTLSLTLYAVVFSRGYVAHLLDEAVPMWPEGHLGFDNIRFFNQYQTWTLPFVAVGPVLLGRHSRLLRGGLYGVAAVWWMLLFASGGRGATIGAGLGLVAVLIFYRRSAWRWLKGQLMALLGGGVLFYLLYELPGSAARATVMERDFVKGGHRLEAWGQALEMMLQAPILGVGPMHYAYFPSGAIWGHPHNAVLQWAAEWGLVATAIIIGLAGWGGWAWVRQSRHRVMTDDGDGVVRVALTAALVAGAAHALVSGVVVMPVSQVLLVVVVGWTLGKYLHARSGGQTDIQHSGWIARAVVAASLAAVLWGTWSDVPRLEEKRNAFIKEQEVSRIHPRYWQQGFFGY